MPLYTQEGRLISLTTQLGDDVLLLTGFTGHEAISRLFCFHLTALSENDSIDFSSIIGTNVTINISQQDNSKCYFNGIVSQFICTGKESDMGQYELEVVPALWTLTRYADCRIFHNKSVVDIVQSVLSDRSIHYRSSLTGTYSAMEYCVQYRETDFNFVSRLMEQYGIFYFFEHQNGRHTMVLADNASALQQCPGGGKAIYNQVAGGLDSADVINQWSIGQELRSGKFTHTDYNFTTSQASLLASESTIYSVGGNDAMEIFDFPGLHTKVSDGADLAKIRMEEEEAVHKVARGSGVCRFFVSGYKFDLQDHPIEAMNGSYLLTEIRHTASVSSTYGETKNPENGSYSNTFVCIPANIVFRPARLTPKPFVQGPQTARVVGKSSDEDSADDDSSGGDGEEIWVDKWGRVLVQFPWDRAKAASCWMRVSHDWAGAGWGMFSVPRVGQEVIVSFLEGDPDRPIITGRVYNDVQTVPYALPDYGTRTTFKTRSTTGGGKDNYNELRFEDKTGSEQVFLRAEKDCDTRIKNDSREWIGNNRSLIVTKDQMEKVGGNVHLQVKGNRNEKITGDWNSQINGNINQKSSQAISIQAGTNLYEKSGQIFAHEAGQTIHLKAGMEMILEAGAELTLKVGGNFIGINPSGVSIVGTLVMINSGGSAGSGPGSSPSDPAAPTDPDEADDGSKGTKMN
jgi:type VI secretion system secreted protein VgrG